VTAGSSVARVRTAAAGPSTQAWLLPHLIALVEREGADAAPIRRLRGLSDLTDPDVRVPEASVEAAWQLAESLTRDAAVGIHLAESLPRGALDLVEYAFRSSASLVSGLERLARYGRVMSDRVSARVEGNGDCTLLFVRDTGPAALHPGRSEFALAAALKFAREGTGVDLTPLQVCFSHPAPEDRFEHRRYFRTDVRFGAGSTSMILSAADAMRPLAGADDALSAIVRRRLDKLLHEREARHTGSLTARVRHILVDQLGEKTLTPQLAADALAISPRTLSRRLAEEGTSFRVLLDDVRREFACALLHDRSLSVGDVAFFLQYSEPAAFHRSFRRWTGLTPRAFRHS
jgi:AraC-like DNA-binding protein